MELKVYHAFWGMEGSLREKMERAAQHGYAGVEAPLPSPEEENEFNELREELGLGYIAQIYTHGRHADSFLSQVERAVTFRPHLINSHSGKDSWGTEEQDRFFAYAVQVEKQFGVPIGHETHRGRAMYAPWSTARLLRLFPELRLTADLSHFTCVCESMLQDQEDDMAIILERTIHLHARIGFEQGPQVPHPAAPEYAYALERFEGWWETVLQRRKSEGHPYATVTPEFGPPGYMPRIPFMAQPVADLFEVNHWTASRFRERHGHLTSR